ncbi:MAG: hypothetical protein K2O65_14515 [Lachnospiraceae bacterium]|nr:hypothetical protein [Lachnospiraceae bacterium]
MKDLDFTLCGYSFKLKERDLNGFPACRINPKFKVLRIGSDGKYSCIGRCMSVSEGRAKAKYYVRDTLMKNYEMLKSYGISQLDIDKLLAKCLDKDISFDQLFRQFFADLLDTENSGGSDERMLVNDWFRRSF